MPQRCRVASRILNIASGAQPQSHHRGFLARIGTSNYVLRKDTAKLPGSCATAEAPEPFNGGYNSSMLFRKPGEHAASRREALPCALAKQLLPAWLDFFAQRPVGRERSTNAPILGGLSMKVHLQRTSIGSCFRRELHQGG